MTVYEYQCQTCNKVFEKEYSIKKYKNIIEICPHCGNKNGKRLYSPALLNFVGKWFKTTGGY